MDTANLDKNKRAIYEMLLTCLCQCGLANAWGWCRPVADPAHAIIDVATYTRAFGDKYIRRLVWGLREYVDRELLGAPLLPLLCSGQHLDRVLHITASCLDIFGSLNGKDILIWDAGKGSRMGSLLGGGKSKGDAYVCGNQKLYHFSAGAAR